MPRDANERFARLVLLCESLKCGGRPTMTEQERIAVALVLGRSAWLRGRGLSAANAAAHIGPHYAAVLARVRGVVNEKTGY